MSGTNIPNYVTNIQEPSPTSLPPLSWGSELESNQHTPFILRMLFPKKAMQLLKGDEERV